MEELSAETSTEDKILYELTVPCEWPEVTTALPSKADASLWRTIASVTRAFAHFVVEKVQHPLRFLHGYHGIPSTLTTILEARLPWKIAISRDGSLLAVLREGQLEIRSIVDEFESVLTNCPVPQDSLPRARQLVWNDDGTLIAVGLSTGAVYVFSSSGRLLTQLIDKVSPGDASSTSPLTTVTFVPHPSDPEDDDVVSLLCVLYHGRNLETYEIREKGGPLFLHTFSFSDYFPNGVDCLLYHQKLSILIAGATPSDGAESAVISGWRLIDGTPHWAPRLGQGELLRKKPKGVLSGLFRKSNAQDGNGIVCGMSVSPNEELLACIEASGRLSLWELPSFRCTKSWSRQEQPHLIQAESLGGKRKGLVLPVDISWWSDEALIVVDTAGHVTVPSIRTLKNLLGDHPEPGCAITHSCNGQFFILDCESSKTPLRGRFRVPSLSEESEPEDESPGHTELSLVSASSRLLKQVLFFLTESDRFKPPKKKPRVVRDKYSLACLKSMPPEVCYERKMMNEEYGEALVLAQQYGLDCDLVYLRQWRSYPVSIATIQDYLSKIEKRAEVLQECISRVPEDHETTRQLLEYGLSRTSFKELRLAGGEELLELEGEGDEDSLSLEETQEMISQWDKLTSEQISICQYRHLLLSYLDRLSTYEVFLGGPRHADEKFNCDEFEELRSANLVQSAVQYAQEGDFGAVTAFFTYHGVVTLPHRLAILSNFPETLSPQSYQHLLPSVSCEGVEEWAVEAHRSPDWVESEAVTRLCVLPNETHTNRGDFIYEETPEWRQYLSASTGETLTSWYKERASEIEEFSGQVDCALQLIEFGVKKGVQSLDMLRHHLQTLYSLVYKCNADSRLTLSRLQSMSNLETLTLMLSGSEAEFVEVFIDCAQPFLSRLDALQPGVGEQLLTEYLTTVAKNDLGPCLSLFQQSRGTGPAGEQDPIIKTDLQFMTLALRVVYACERSDQLSLAYSILECLPTNSGDESLADLHSQVDLLEGHLSALDTLQKYGVQKPVHYIRDIQGDPVEAKELIIKLTRVANRSDSPLTESWWRSLLKDLLMLRADVFTCVEKGTCYKVFAESLLCSGQETNIHLASQLLTLDRGSQQKPTPQLLSSVSPTFNYRLLFNVSCDLVLKAAKEYFNSASSLMDRDMDLARECLDLFPAPPPRAVQTELNLIASLSLLDDFGVSILPVQVRLTENKLDLIRSVLDSSHGVYRNHEKIIRLARLLEDAQDVGTEEEEGRTETQLSPMAGHATILTVLAAMQQRDYKLSEKLCQQLMNACFSPAWEVCRKLAIDYEALETTVRIGLMNFCLTYCPPEEIEFTLSLRQKLHVQSLYGKCMERSSGKGKAGGKAKTSGVPETTAAKTVVQGLMDRGVQGIVRSAGAMHQLIRTRQAPSSVRTEPVAKNSISTVITELEKLADSATTSPRQQDLTVYTHPFYPPYTSGVKGRDSIGTFSYRDWDVCGGDVGVKLVVNQALLYAVQIANTMAGKDEKKMDCTKVLLDLAGECSGVDTHLMLSYLLSLPEKQVADHLFSSLPRSKYALELAIFYICLQIYAELSSSLQQHASNTQPHPYTHNPADVVDHVIHRVKSCDATSWVESVGRLLSLLDKYQERIEDMNQASTLLGLGLGIDTDQFEEDSDYRHSIVLSLTRALDEKVFSIAHKLALRHTIPEWELYMELLDSLLTSSSLKPSEIQRRMKESKLMEVLLCNPQQTYDRLHGNTYEQLRGDNLTAMLSYYIVLQQCSDKGATVEESIPVATHVKILKRLKPNVSGVDYKALMSGEMDPLQLLVPALTINNVHVVAKLADKIPPVKGRGQMTSDMVLRAYTEVLFWKGSKREQEETHSESLPRWIHRYEACQEFLLKLGVDELRQFVRNVVFSEQSLKLDLKVRLELVKRSQRICQQRLKGDTVEGGHQLGAESGFQLLKTELETCYKHLKILSSRELWDVIDKFSVDKEKWEEFERVLDTSISDPDKVHALGLEMLKASLPVDLVHTVLSLTNSVCPNKLSVASLVKELLKECVQLLSNPQPADSAASHIEVLERVLVTVSSHERGGGCLVSSSQLLEMLQPFCSDTRGSHSAQSRRAVLGLIEKYLTLSEDDVGLLLLYQTQSLITADFSTQVSIDELSSPESRQAFFSSLLKESSSSAGKLLTLFSLLESWDNSSSAPGQSWTDLLLAAVHIPSLLETIPVMRVGLKNVPSEVDTTLMEQLSTHSSCTALKLALVTFDPEKIQSTLIAISKQDEFSSDANLLELILTVQCVPTVRKLHPSLYHQVCEHLHTPVSLTDLNTRLFTRLFGCSESELGTRLDIDCPSARVKRVAQQLHTEGLVLEAGSLLVRLQDFHSSVASLNSAVSYVRKLFSSKR